MAQVFPAQPSGIENSFTWQLVELHKTISELATKTDRLIKDVVSQSGTLDAGWHQIAYARGALWVVLAIVGVLSAGFASLYVRGDLTKAFQPVQQSVAPSVK